MPCTPPITRSPGKLELLYAKTGGLIRHSIGWHFIIGVDLSNIALLEAEAQRLAGYMAECLETDMTVADWRIKLPDGSTYYSAPLPAARVGARTTQANMQNYLSTTLCFRGRGNPPLPGVCTGQVSSRLFVGGGFIFSPGSKVFNALSVGATDDFVQLGLNASTYLPADFYGHQADISLLLPIQWNASAQRRLGS
jgi:hypothetical protein